MKNIRCEEVSVHLVVRTYDDTGLTLAERVVGQSNGAGGVIPITVFRNAETLDFWRWVDKTVAAMAQAPDDAPPTPPMVLKKGRGRG